VPTHGVARARVCGAGSVADMGGATVSLPCRGARTGEARGWSDVGEGRGGNAGEGRGGAALSWGGSGSVAGARLEVEGKGDKRAPLGSCLGER
jgi:hypothetical protein